MEDLEDDDEDSCANMRSFLDYFAVYWPDHIRKMSLTQNPEAINLLHQVYAITPRRFSLWFPIFWRSIVPYGNLPKWSALHLASFNGHEREVDFLLSTTRNDINSRDSTGAYPLSLPSMNGHEKIVRLLLEKGANVNTKGEPYANALEAASYVGHDKIV
jgi:ankyrin repeat protein